MVRAMSLNITPAIPGTKRTGKNTEIVVRVEAMIAVATSAVPRSALIQRVTTLAEITEYIFQYHDRIIHKQAHSKGQPCHGHHVEGELGQIQHSECHHNGYGGW